MMALTEGRLTGRPGICFVTRGPGATNAAHGVHIAEHDSAPMILFVGQVERAMLGRGAFQEMDYRALFASTAKWVDADRNCGANPRDHPARVPRRHAGPARPGGDRAARRHADGKGGGGRRAARRAGPDLAGPDADGRTAEDAVERASGRSPSSAGPDGPSGPAPPSPGSPSASTCPSPARSAAPALSTASTTISPAKSGSPSIRSSRRASRRPISCMLVGGRMSEAAAQGYTLFEIPAPRQRLVHVHADATRDRPQLSSDAWNRRDLARVLRRARRRRAAGDDSLVGRDARRRVPTISPGASRRRQIRAGCN